MLVVRSAMHQDNLWAVVLFIDDNSIAIVPSNWILKKESTDFAFWPPKSNSVTVLVKKRQTPSPNWTQHKIRIYGHYGKHSIFITEI